MILLTCQIEKNVLFKSVEEVSKFVEEAAKLKTINNNIYRPIGDIVQERLLNDSIMAKYNIQPD